MPLRLKFSRLFSSSWFRRRRYRAPEPLHFTDLKSRSADQWRSALSESPEQAARWIYAAAVYGEIDAQLVWAQMQLDGRGTSRDAEGAFRWFSVAANSNRPDAINLLGRCHERGWGTPVDYEKAAACYRLAAEKSYDWSLFNLGCFLLDGKGVDRNPDAAFECFTKAVQQGHIKSLYMIGRCYENGWGCHRDMTTAAAWYRQSAEAGDFRGQHRLGVLLTEHDSLAEGLIWLQAAVDNAPAGFCREIAPGLLERRENQIRTIGASAQAKANLSPKSP